MSLDHYRSSLASAMGLDAARFQTPGVTVVADDDRRGRRLVSHYRIGEHSVVWIDPEVVEPVVSLHGRSASMSFDEFRTWALERRAERLGSGYEHILPEPLDAPPGTNEVRRLVGGDGDVVDSARTLFESCPADDVEEADFELDALDEYLTGWFDEGRLIALAGGRLFAQRPGYFDLGVLVHPDARRTGRGRQVVAAAASAILADGRHPLYRCEVQHEGSWRLCRGLGFVPVLELEAFRWPVAT